VEHDIDKRFDKVEEKLDLLMMEVAGLKVKASVWGLLAGLIPTTIGLAMWALSISL